jgi:DNA-directed RNA polymerase specialized sigma24 family protein
VYCYRFLGSVADAEDALQDTLLSAWQGLPGFEARASVRTWRWGAEGRKGTGTLRRAGSRVGVRDILC